MKNRILFLLLTFITFSALVSLGQSSTGLWQEVNGSSLTFRTDADRWATDYTAYTLDIGLMRTLLSDAPSQEAVPLKKSDFLFSLPMPDGSFSLFRMVESPCMMPGLAKAYPSIRTYAGQGITDPAATLRCDVTPFGFHAMAISPRGTVFVDPVSLQTNSEYVSYYKRNAIPQDIVQECLVDESCSSEEFHHDPGTGSSAERVIEGELRNYRLALACTGEYAAFYGGTVAGALAGMITTLNRVNGVYEREFGIHMNLVDNDTLLIFTNASTDPYSNNNGGTMLNQNQTTCNNLIGSANYDHGHVFSTGGGGIANLACICKSSSKAKGVTGLGSPIGDSFDIDYVAHEMGHQYGANHTFNATAGACSGNRVASAAYEPGSASTIMGYAGICGTQDLQPHSDDYFHTYSFDEIINYTQSGLGNGCAVIDTNGNHAPDLIVPENDTIPLSTPFRLTAEATDPDGDSLTYCWEEFDLGPAGNWNSPTGNAPIFRSFLPVTTGTRIFPKLQNILSNTATIGEWLPTYSRTLNFRCVVRDNQLSGAGVTYNDNTVKIFVANTPGPFAVLTPNTTGIVWVANSIDSVTWSVNGSDLPPVSTPTVNVLLSLDGGYTWPITLGAGVPNNGSFSFTVPDTASTTCRVMVEGDGSIFFDINDKNFSITQTVGLDPRSLAASIVLYPNPTNGSLSLEMTNTEKGRVLISLSDITGKRILQSSLEKSGYYLQERLDLSNLEKGLYLMTVECAGVRTVKKVVVE